MVPSILNTLLCLIICIIVNYWRRLKLF
jgi:hypothetical protein